MKNFYKVIAIILVIALLFFGFLQFHKRTAYSDGLTAQIIAGCSYALMDSWGISFTAGNATASGMSDFMTGQVESYVNSNGGSIYSLFGSEIARNVAGKLVVGYQLYNGVRDFVDWLSDSYDLSTEDFTLTNGEADGLFVPTAILDASVDIDPDGISVLFTNPGSGGFKTVNVYNKGSSIYSYTYNSSYSGHYYGTWSVEPNNANTLYGVVLTGRNDNNREARSFISLGYVSSLNNKLSWNGAGYVTPVVLNPNQGWEGTIPAAPDTNLEDLLEHIFESVVDNNLVVDGEVIDIPVPIPTPIPIDPDTPLQDVPWEGLDTNLQNLYNQGLEEIGAIGDAQDAITDALTDQTGALEDAIADNAGVVSGAIGQAVSDIQDSISEQTEALSESATATAAATESIAEALEDETINWQKFDLRGLFPFCIPFDIYNMLEALDASPTAPNVQLPFVIDSINFSYTIDLDFSAFDQVAAIMRQMELIAYAIALAWATSKVIKW